MPMQVWRRSRWHRKSSRQSQEKADGVTPAGFVCIRRRATLAPRALAGPFAIARNNPSEAGL